MSNNRTGDFLYLWDDLKTRLLRSKKNYTNEELLHLMNQMEAYFITMEKYGKSSSSFAEDQMDSFLTSR